MTADYSSNLPMRVLVVDDEPEVAQMIAICLGQGDFSVKAVNDAVTAYTLLDTEVYDTIITDVMMPGVDGLTFLAKVHDRFPDLPVIIMTGYAQLQMAVNAIKNGAFDFIHKPFDFDYLRKIVTKAVTHSRLLEMQKNYREELERTVTQKTEELKNALAELDSTRAVLLRGAREKSDFMATITHEMRTPMNGVIGALDLLHETDLNGSQSEFLSMARQSAANMLGLVERVLGYVEGFSKGGDDFCSDLDLPVTIEGLLMEHRSRFATRGIRFDVVMEQGVPRRIRSNQEYLLRIIDILLANALKFTHSGGVQMKFSASGKNGERTLLRVQVSDSGIGIPEEMLEKIFEPFVQIDHARNRRYEGLGLGLSIARQTAQLLGGRLWAENNRDGGSSFHLELAVDTL